MARWHIAETRDRVSARFGPGQLELMKNCLRSVCERQRHARFHFQEARRLMKEHIDDRLAETSIHQITWPIDPEERVAFDFCFMAVEAHVIACSQAIHSVADNLAHVAYFAFGVNLGTHKLNERDVSLQRVAEVLSKHFPGSSEAVLVLRRLHCDPAFKVVEAFVNTTKHRGYADTRINVDPINPGSRYSLEFGAFDYRDVDHPERDIESVLAPAYAAASAAVVECGNAINAAS